MTQTDISITFLKQTELLLAEKWALIPFSNVENKAQQSLLYMSFTHYTFLIEKGTFL